jgi:hypothetical protein
MMSARISWMIPNGDDARDGRPDCSGAHAWPGDGARFGEDQGGATDRAAAEMHEVPFAGEAVDG